MPKVKGEEDGLVYTPDDKEEINALGRLLGSGSGLGLVKEEVNAIGRLLGSGSGLGLVKEEVNAIGRLFGLGFVKEETHDPAPIPNP